MKNLMCFKKQKVKTYRNLNVYQQSFDLAITILRLTKGFPPEERYGITDQLRRAASSIPANLAEGWAKRKYENVFRRHMIDCIGSCEEVKVWLEISWKCCYVDQTTFENLQRQYSEIGAMLTSLANRWKTY